jgi:hypothetical protein
MNSHESTKATKAKRMGTVPRVNTDVNMEDTTDADVAAVVQGCASAASKVYTALSTIAENRHQVSRYRPQLQDAAPAVASKTERGKPVAPQT